jgi:hypothetical protein
MNNHNFFSDLKLMRKSTDTWLISMKNKNKIAYDEMLHKGRFNVFASSNNSNPFKNPQNTSPTDVFDKNATDGANQADQNAGVSSPDKRPPMTIHEGLQTIVNIARTGSGYDPLDQPTQDKPKSSGDSEHFFAFVDAINAAPFLTMEFGGSKTVKQASHNSDDLIDSFVNTFDGIATKDINGIKNGLKSLVSAALSYSEQTQTESNFVQAICDQDDSGNVTISLYGSVFNIYVKEHKGTIDYVASYSINQAKWSLSPSMWTDVLRDKIQDQLNQSTDNWLDKNKTKPSGNPSFNLSKLCIK